MVKCPTCGSEFTQILKEWEYASYHVKRINCTNCHETFNAYYRQDELNHIILDRNRRPTTQSKVRQYLKAHGNARVEEIAKALGLREVQVLNTLIELENKGIAINSL